MKTKRSASVTATVNSLRKSGSVLVSVTQNDIDKGCIWSRNNCPIALALQRIFKSDKICVSSFWIWTNPHKAAIKLPKSARCFVNKFDADEHVEPFKFRIPTRKLLKELYG